MLVFQVLDTLCLTNSTPILGDGLGLNFPTWSISSEMISYLIFGFMMVFVPSHHKMKAIVGLIVICFLFLLYQERYFLTGTWGFVRGLLCFNLGYIVYVTANIDFKLPSPFELVLSIALLVLFYLLNQHNFTVQRELLALVFVPLLFAIFIWVLLKSNGLISRLLETSPFQFVGKISYSIYLNHALIVVVIPRILFDLLLWERTNVHLIWSAILVIIVLFSYSVFTYQIIELKFGKMFKSILNKTEPN
jgi:peptidoglycan/LPS O-acetylase OafA/YrhL